MAWPLTPLTTYTSTTTPAIKASDLNAFQSAINGIVAATYSLAAVVVDGTGGVVVTPTAGTVKVSGAISGASTLPNATIPIGTIYKEHVLVAMAQVQGGNPPTVISGVNIASISRVSTGFYNLNLNVSVPTTNMVPILSLFSAPGYIFLNSYSSTQLVIETQNVSQVNSDAYTFSVLLFSTA